MRIVVIEDHPSDREDLYTIFSRYGACDVVSDEKEAIAVLCRRKNSYKALVKNSAKSGIPAPAKKVAGAPGGSPQAKNHPAMPKSAPLQKGEGYFRSVRALPGYLLEVSMETGSFIRFSFCGRLNTARFGTLRDEELFRSVQTDGNYLIFQKAGKMPVKITASEFMDLVLIDRGM